MATLTIKIDSEDLAREVLTHLGYLPEDDVPDLVSVEAEDAEEHLKKLVSAFPNASERVKFLKSVKTDDDADEDMRQAASKMLGVEEDNGTLIDALKEWSKHEIVAGERVPKTHMEEIADHMTQFGRPKSSRHEYNYKYEGTFCTTDEPKEGVEPLDKELGTPLSNVFTEEVAKERDELYQQSLEVRKTIPNAAERLATQVDELEGGDRLDHLDALADNDDPAMRKAVKAYILKEYAGHDLKLWPALQKILDGNT